MKKFKLVTLVLLILVIACSVTLVGCDLLGSNPGGKGNKQATGTVDLYAINDFHGEYGKLAQISGYINAQANNPNTVTLNSGDMFQGSMESNSNYGRLFSQCMDIAGFDAFTYGNHEFDWGLDNLRSLAQNSATPFLGANIYNWNANNKTWGDFAEDLAQEYIIKDMDNGLRVGVIGIIGKDQITSISSQLVQTIGFMDPKLIVPNLSSKLKNELNCDIVVISAHTGQETFLSDKSWDITRYADAVFCAHTHQQEKTIKNGVPFIQGGSYGSYVSHVQLTVDSNGNVTCDDYSNIAYNNLSGVNSFTKDRVQMEIDNSNSRIADEATEVLATLTGGYLNSSTAVPRLVAHAIAEYANAQGQDIDLVMVNNARNSLQAGNITYTALYEAIPFDNVVYIATVSGRDILNEAKYDSNSIWRVSGTAIEYSDIKYYTIAVIDYLLFHQSSNRSYNYFPSAFRSGITPVALTKTGVDMYNYRLITRDFLRLQGSIVASTYTSDANIRTNKNLLEQSVTFD
ncbi:MAG: bifunctional metallophosphatase/5'-nucleotidase [Clostridiales bacterium]|nr:bifunctional metallophosphatase/5'-nucleotidase [Clostridiales bacterium]